MPVWIDALRESGVCICAKPFAGNRLAIGCTIGSRVTFFNFALHKSRSMFASQLESELLWIGAVSCVATHTLAWYRLTLDDGFFLPVVYIALEVADVAIYLITWSKLAVGQAIIIKRPFAHVDREVFILKPATFDLCTDCYNQLSSNVLSSQLVPLFYIKFCIIAIGSNLSALASLHCYIHAFSISFLAQRSIIH